MSEDNLPMSKTTRDCAINGRAEVRCSVEMEKMDGIEGRRCSPTHRPARDSTFVLQQRLSHNGGTHVDIQDAENHALNK